jgi:hypothetical protein
MTRLVLHIDRIVLDGVAHGDRHAFARGLQEALGTALGERGASTAWARQAGAARIDVGVVQVPHATSASDLGARAARHIVGRAWR